jgi:DNA repair protein RadC
MSYPEVQLLATLVGDGAARKVTAAAGGWRTLSAAELEQLRLRPRVKDAVLALQALTLRPFAELPKGRLGDAATVAGFYGERLAAVEHEVVIAIALDGQHRLLGEFEVARGGRHGAALTAADVLRPVIRANASALILVHNHPSGDPSPSADDVHMTKAIRNACMIVGIPLLDHIVIGARGGGYVSLSERGILEEV